MKIGEAALTITSYICIDIGQCSWCWLAIEGWQEKLTLSQLYVLSRCNDETGDKEEVVHQQSYPALDEINAKAARRCSGPLCRPLLCTGNTY